jgi:propanol-preferring alcohol dehydrogenase
MSTNTIERPLPGTKIGGIPKTMKAALVHAFGQPLTIQEVPVPAPGPGEVLVEVTACGVCHTDLHAADGDLAG